MTKWFFQVMYISPDRIFNLRQSLHLTQGELGRRIGVTPRCVQRWEHDHRRPHLKNVRKLLKLEREVAAECTRIAMEMAKREQQQGVT